MIGTIRSGTAQQDRGEALPRRGQDSCRACAPERAEPDLAGNARMRNAPLAGLAGSAVSDRFRAWRGRSGRRYVFSVFRAGMGAAGLDRVPLDDEAVVIATERQRDGARAMLWIGETGPNVDSFLTGAPVRALAAREDCELHLHFLAADAAERRSVVDDLRAD